MPAHYRIPAYVTTLGPIVADLCDAVGFGPDPEQRLALDLAFARTSTGISAAFELALIACRQNIKTGFFKQLELGWLFVTDERLVVHSAHEFNTSRETFRDLKDLIESSPMLCKRIPVNGIRTGNGDQSIETKTGARLVFKTRTKSGGRGLSGRKIVLDEAFALQADHMGALLPLVSAQPDPQIFYGSSAARPESAVLHGLVKRIRGTDPDPRLAALEWCAPPPAEACNLGDACGHAVGTPGCGFDKRELIQLGNTQAGKRITFETIESERLAMSATPEEFGRERMGWHDVPAEGNPAIDADDWKACKDVEHALVGRPAISFDVKPGGTAAVIVAVGRLDVKDGDPWRSEITGRDGAVDCRTGTDWLVPRLAQVAADNNVCALVLDAAGPAGAFEQALLGYRLDRDDPKSTVFVQLADDEAVPRGKTRLVTVTAREYAQACGALDDDVRNRRWRHFDQRPMNEAVEGARTQPLADAWKWSRKDSNVFIGPLVACTLARHGFARFGGDKPRPKPWAL